MSSNFPFDPWSASREEARKQPGPVVQQWIAAQLITENRSRIETDGPALLAAISKIAKHRLVMPDWLASAYTARFAKLERLECGSLDEAFGPLPFGSGKRLAQLRRRRRLIPAVSRALIDALNVDPSRPIDTNLFEEVGQQLGIGHTLAEELYREGVTRHGMQDLREMKALQLFPFDSTVTPANR